MNIVIGIVVFIVFIYTAGFSLSLWKDKNKPGSFAVFIFAISILVVPFFSEIG